MIFWDIKQASVHLRRFKQYIVMFSDHDRIELEISNRKTLRKSLNIWRLTDIHLNNQGCKEKLKWKSESI